MNRRQLFPALAAALTLAPVAAFAKLEPEISATAVRDLGVKCAGCGEGPHFHRLDQEAQFSLETKGREAGHVTYSHSLETWMTPKGVVRIRRWPSMDHSHVMGAVEDAMRGIYGPLD